jgi:hypothetical protein
MAISKNIYKFVIFSTVLLFAAVSAATAQSNTKNEILTGDSLKRIVPTSFYFAGQSAETQMRNAAAAKIGENRYVIVGLVDTSGYSTEISGKYEGFFITDSPVNIGDKMLDTGAYGFGFAKEGQIRFFDLSSKEILSVATMNDAEMKRPRPLMMTGETNGVRLYKGKNYVLISAK